MVSCCGIGSIDQEGREVGGCPSCGRRGRPVSSFTISVMVKDKELYLHPERLRQAKYFFCETKSCSTVYFDDSGKFIVDKIGLRAKVWQKEDDPQVPACYCFHHSVSSIAREILERGTTDVVARISGEVKARNCRCEVTNPQGSCCLGNVVKAVEIAKRIAAPTAALLVKIPTISKTRRDGK